LLFQAPFECLASMPPPATVARFAGDIESYSFPPGCLQSPPLLIAALIALCCRPAMDFELLGAARGPAGLKVSFRPPHRRPPFYYSPPFLAHLPLGVVVLPPAGERCSRSDVPFSACNLRPLSQYAERRTTSLCTP